MACSIVPWILLLSAVTSIILKTAEGSNLSQVSTSKDKCQNVYTSNNFYAGPSKKIETLLHEVKKELREIREEIKSLKENKTIGEGMCPKLPNMNAL